jgi:hypothetical protein
MTKSIHLLKTEEVLRNYFMSNFIHYYFER